MRQRHAQIDNASNLTPEQKEIFKDTYDKIMRNPESVEEIRKQLEKIQKERQTGKSK